MVGNTVVKHASMVPQCAIAIEDLFNEVGPNGLYTNL
jgi:succinate-semialdehyde dehydrogenase/glutarate-semialdehyde dehydrogenase